MSYDTDEKVSPETRIAERAGLPASTLCRCGSSVTRDRIDPVEETGNVAAVWPCRCGRTRYDLIDPDSGSLIETAWR